MTWKTKLRHAIFVAAAPIAFVAFAIASEQAAGQEPARGETVANRARPELDPLGIRAGGFLFFPQLGVGAKYDDNVFAQPTNEVNDTIYLVQPQLALRSNWNNHALNFTAGAEAAYYTDYDSEDYVDAFAGTDFRVDVSRDSYLNGALKYSKLHEDRGSPDDAGGIEPTEYSLLAANAGYTNDFGLISVGISGAFGRYNFDDNVGQLPGPVFFVINNDDRDRDAWQGALRLGIDLSPNFEAFVRGTYFVVNYKDPVDDDGQNRDSKGYEAVAGVAFDLTGVTVGELFAGYRKQNPDDPDFDSIKGAQFGGAVTWNPSGLTTVRLQGQREVQETTQLNSPGYLSTSADLMIDHELLRNLILGASGGYEKRDFEGIVRQDTRIDAGAYAKYLMNRHLYISLNYDYADQSSDINADEFTRNVVMLRLQTQY